ncbi:Crp/Fnr family transcriptional regulator [Fluviicola taffensis]|uniref:Crp/Fnr family transcriptional regulator n=1 Tax=Fluviicola taffensis TaxID=191579 RepID=UPI00313813E8
MTAIEWASLFGLESITVPARTRLLEEGSIARKMYIIEKGALRIWLNKNGNEITSQFFFEGKLVTSLESFLSLQTSDFCLETIEESKLFVLDKITFDELMRNDTNFKEWFQDYILDRFLYYSKHVLSFLRDEPEERYIHLLNTNPLLLERVSQQDLASYIGITPVSLSHIRNKVTGK